MDEYWDVYDRYKRKTGKIIKRNSNEILQEGEYHLVVTGVVINQENKILISRRNAQKDLYPGLWECSGGSVKRGERSINAIIRELYEELGIELKESEGKFLGGVQQYDYFRDVWKFYKNISLDEVKFIDGEVDKVLWVTENEYKVMFEKNLINPTGDCIIKLLEKERECER